MNPPVATRLKIMHPGHSLKSLALCALLLATANACTHNAPEYLSSAQLEALDSLATIQIPLVRQEEDSICQATFEQRLRHLVDSLLLARRQEEARLRQIIPRQ